ncbi:MAG: hypothetical protein E6Q83_04195 [Thiothrix sp.]|nr:MAG: hypothetical protein E6Q83_04195 [Thiothrix sp.]
MIQPFKLDDGTTIYVKVDADKLPSLVTAQTNLPSDLPPGAEPTGIGSTMIDTAKLLNQTISGTAKSVLDSLQALQPDEWSVEINIAFKGERPP